MTTTSQDTKIWNKINNTKIGRESNEPQFLEPGFLFPNMKKKYKGMFTLVVVPAYQDEVYDGSMIELDEIPDDAEIIDHDYFLVCNKEPYFYDQDPTDNSKHIFYSSSDFFMELIDDMGIIGFDTSLDVDYIDDYNLMCFSRETIEFDWEVDNSGCLKLNGMRDVDIVAWVRAMSESIYSSIASIYCTDDEPSDDTEFCFLYNHREHLQECAGCRCCFFYKNYILWGPAEREEENRRIQRTSCLGNMISL